MTANWTQQIRDQLMKTPFSPLIEEEKLHRKPPRTFTISQKNKCWAQARILPGRSPARWRLDPYGNPVLKQLRGCQGALCHEYDHIVPFSKGGTTTLDNCQILQTQVNRFKSNKTNLTFDQLNGASLKVDLTQTNMDLIEQLVYGNLA